MATYRVGKHWERTIVEEGTGVPDEHGHRRGDKLVGVVDDPELAAEIVELLNGQPRAEQLPS